MLCLEFSKLSIGRFLVQGSKTTICHTSWTVKADYSKPKSLKSKHHKWMPQVFRKSGHSGSAHSRTPNFMVITYDMPKSNHVNQHSRH